MAPKAKAYSTPTDGIDAVEADFGSEDVLRVRERDDREGRDRREDRDQRREREEEADRGGRAELLLEQQLADVRDRLERAERPDAVGADAVLEAAEQLALHDEDQRHELQADGEDHERLEDLTHQGSK
jgi:hypothetical protein